MVSVGSEHGTSPPDAISSGGGHGAGGSGGGGGGEGGGGELLDGRLAVHAFAYLAGFLLVAPFKAPPL